MDNVIYCERYRCYANRCMRCRLLREAFTSKPCPFYKTDEEVIEGRLTAIERLHEKGLDDLIHTYTDNEKGYAL